MSYPPQQDGEQWVICYREVGEEEYHVFDAVYNEGDQRLGVKRCMDKHPDAAVWADHNKRTPFPRDRGYA